MHIHVYILATVSPSVELTTEFLQLIHCVEIYCWRCWCLRCVNAATITVIAHIFVRWWSDGRERYNEHAGFGVVLHFDHCLVAGRCKFAVRWGGCGRCNGHFVAQHIASVLCAASVRAGHEQEESRQRQKCGHIPNNGYDVHGSLWQFVGLFVYCWKVNTKTSLLLKGLYKKYSK